MFSFLSVFLSDALDVEDARRIEGRIIKGNNAIISIIKTKSTPIVGTQTDFL